MRFDHSAETVPTPSWSALRPPPGIWAWWAAPAMRIERDTSGQLRSDGARARICAAMPATMGAASSEILRFLLQRRSVLSREAGRREVPAHPSRDTPVGFLCRVICPI
jgi:hypothetical protein